MLLQDAKFVGAYVFTSKKKDENGNEKETKWCSVSFETPSPEGAIGSQYQNFLMFPDRVPKDLKEHLNKNCIVDYSKNFANTILFI